MEPKKKLITRSSEKLIKHQRLRIEVQGLVQGVGFRPYIYRLASGLKLGGHVINNTHCVTIEVEGPSESLDTFIKALPLQKPTMAQISHLQIIPCSLQNEIDFHIKISSDSSEKTVLISPDLSTCRDCLKEILDPMNRRFFYPFTNCTQCGPRFSIIQGLPYDRDKTTMRTFSMCFLCQLEYLDPCDRRFHAQPNACHHCGPQLEFWDSHGKKFSVHTLEVLKLVASKLKAGGIVAIKGLGGFQLFADASQTLTIQRLRKGKKRNDKPFALMFPSLEMLRKYASVTEAEADLLQSPAAPIVLVMAKRNPCPSWPISSLVAPANPYYGVMLPYTPLHHLLMRELHRPMVATSGNLSDEPICYEEEEAIDRLKNIADFFLMHNRPIARPLDDSIAQIIEGQLQILRIGRGYAPVYMPGISQSREGDLKRALSLGGHLKSSFALNLGDKTLISQHLGDLQDAKAYHTFQKEILKIRTLYEIQPHMLYCDSHPQYLSTQYALELAQESSSSPLQVHSVQHHLAHVLSCIMEHQLKGPVLGVAWDGSGHGLDGCIWGGEFILVDNEIRNARRVGHFRYFPLPGGEKAVREGRRSALGSLYELFGDDLFIDHKNRRILTALFSENEIRILSNMLKKKIHTPLTSSVGRLFDTVSAILQLRSHSTFEGQAAMDLEFSLLSSSTYSMLKKAVTRESEGNVYSLPIKEDPLNKTLILDWGPMIKDIVQNWDEDSINVKNRNKIQQNKVLTISKRFHETLVKSIVTMAKIQKVENVALSGGCFQNRYLLGRSLQELKRAGLRPFFPQLLPTHDSGLCLGQLLGQQVSFKIRNKKCAWPYLGKS